MKLLDKIKNAIFEPDDELDELEQNINKEPEKPKQEIRQDEVVRKIDIEKTIPKKIELPKEKVEEPKMVDRMPKREHRKTPVIFSDEDFVMEEEKIIPKKPVKIKEEPKKPLYGGYKDDKPKEKFKPSPIISPVYGFVGGASPILEQPRNEELSSFNEMFEKEKKPTVTLETVRQKAFGVEKQEDDDLGLLYEMKNDEKPAISKITLGDAEEYFDDLGLEYNIDYKDEAKENVVKQTKTTRSTKNKKLTEKVEEQIEEQKKLEKTGELEITKEQLKPKTAKEIKKVKKIDDSELSSPKKEEEPEEKNLYDLIDMMYENKE